MNFPRLTAHTAARGLTREMSATFGNLKQENKKMEEKYDSFENGSFCIDINHARRFGIGSALMITQFKQGEDRVFCRSFPSGNGYSRYLKDLLPICDADAMTIMFAAFKPDQPIPDNVKLVSIDSLIEDAKKKNAKFWITDNEQGVMP